MRNGILHWGSGVAVHVSHVAVSILLEGYQQIRLLVAPVHTCWGQLSLP